ncbi:MAG TPA: hypothetical protein VGG75_22125 [Trebonia sp.]|jgi:hypothetical protein
MTETMTQPNATADGGNHGFRDRPEPEEHPSRPRVQQARQRGRGRSAGGTGLLLPGHAGRAAAITTFPEQAPEGFGPHAEHEGRAGR